MNDAAIYGAGALGQYLAARLRAAGGAVVFVDDTPEKQGTSIDGAAVCSPAQFARREAENENENTPLYVCIWQPHFDFEKKRRALWEEHGLRAQHFGALARRLLKDGDRFMFLEPAAALKRKRHRYGKLAARLKDGESRRALAGHLRFRRGGGVDTLARHLPAHAPAPVRALPPGICYVDAGAYDGDTIEEFINETGAGETLREVIAIEPDAENRRRLQARFADNLGGRLRLFENALAGSRGARRFQSFGDVASRLVEDDEAAAANPLRAGGVEREVQTALLEDVAAAPPVFIKMDIEGAEVETVRAAQKYIAAARPYLKLSAYHRPDDLLDLFELLAGEDLNYDFYLRQYENAGSGVWDGMDLMLYAVPRENGQ